MLHLEEGVTYTIEGTADGYGGIEDERLDVVENAPTWFTLKQRSGSMSQYKGGTVPDYEFELKCNYKDDFTWATEMVVLCRGFFIKISSVVESDRLRGITLLGNNLPSESWAAVSA